MHNLSRPVDMSSTARNMDDGRLWMKFSVLFLQTCEVEAIGKYVQTFDVCTTAYPTDSNLMMVSINLVPTKLT